MARNIVARIAFAKCVAKPDWPHGWEGNAVTTTISKPPPETENGEIEAYREFVEAVAKVADGRTIFNRSPSHAAVVIETLLRGATKEFDVLTGELFKPVYATAGVIQAAVDFLKNNPAAEIR